MMMEKPVVATKVDAIPYVVGDAGLLVDIDDYKRASELVITIFKDKGLKSQLIKKGIVQAKRFDVNKTAKETNDLLNSLEG